MSVGGAAVAGRSDAWGSETLDMPKFRLLGALAIALPITLGACAPMVDVRGNAPDAELLAALKEGVTTRDQAREQLGSPSAIGTFDDNVWYYISKRTEQTSFFAPKVLEQRVVMLRFNDTGRLAEFKQLDLSDSNEITSVARETPTAGHNLTLIEQLVGNLGRFNQGDRSGRSSRPGGL